MKKKKIELKGSWVVWSRVGFGITIYALFARAYISPIGFVWGHGAKGARGDRFTVLGSFVVDWARRSGVRTEINKEILNHFDRISTAGGSKFGKEFMKASGYKYAAGPDQWFLERKKRPASKKSPARKRKARR